LKPTVADPNELKPNVETDPNALPRCSRAINWTTTACIRCALFDCLGESEEMADISSTKKKKKKGLGKLKPF